MSVIHMSLKYLLVCLFWFCNLGLPLWGLRFTGISRDNAFFSFYHSQYFPIICWSLVTNWAKSLICKNKKTKQQQQIDKTFCSFFFLCWENPNFFLFLDKLISLTHIQLYQCDCECNLLSFRCLQPVAFLGVLTTGLKIIWIYWCRRLTPIFYQANLKPNFAEWAHSYLIWMGESQNVLIHWLRPEDIPCQ